MTSDRCEVLIRAREDALIIANDGRPVSRLGVLSLCAADLTEKSGRKEDRPQDYADTSDAQLLHQIADRTVGVYRIDPNRQRRDVRHEEGVSADYQGRYLWELVQNADDAMASTGEDATELIGTKGLGFISVLEITDRPEIFSKSFSFYFSRKASEALLKRLIPQEVRAPTFEIPHPATATPEIAEILQRGYATVIRLPFRNAEIAGKVRKAVEALDHRFLLLSQHIGSLRVEIDERSHTIAVSRSSIEPGVERIALSKSDGDESADNSEWTKWYQQWAYQDEDKRLSVAVCLPNEAKGEPHALAEDDRPPAYMFFPTDETIGARAVVHASLEVTQNRKHFRAGGRNELVYPQMRELVTKMLGRISASAALDAFGGLDPKAGTEAARELASSILNALTEAAFVPIIGGTKVRPRDVKVWWGTFGTVLRPNSVHLRQYKLLHPSVDGRNVILQGLGAKKVETREFFGALRYCRNQSAQDCGRVVDVLANEGLPMIGWHDYGEDWFAQIPCWWTEDGRARSLVGPPLLFEGPAQWPDFIRADALSVAARGHLEAAKEHIPSGGNPEWSIWRTGIIGKFVHPGEYLERALMPAMSEMNDEEWRDHGWSVLFWYRNWSSPRNFDDVSSLPMIWEGELKDAEVFRRKLSRCLRLPTEKGWQPAEKCYADRTWGAPRSLKPYFAEIADRAVVHSLARWKEPLGPAEDLDQWKGLMRFAGVSWEPKLVPTNRLDARDNYDREHLSEFRRHDFDLEIEHFPQCLASERGLLPLVAAGRRLLAAAQRYPARYILPNKQKSQTLKTNFALQQLKHAEWLPHRKSILFPAGAVSAAKAYLPGKGIAGLLPEIAIPDAAQQQRSEIETFLKTIGVNDSLPSDGWAWTEWMERLGDAARIPDVDKSLLLEAANTLYRKFFALKLESRFGWPRLRVPCLVGGETADHLKFMWAREARWVDDPIFDTTDVRRELLGHGYPLFILSMSQAEAADQILGVKRLSESVSLLPISSGIDEEGTRHVIDVYRSRLPALRAFVPESQRLPLREDLRIEATADLSIAIRSDAGIEIAATPARTFLNSYGTLLVAGGGSYLRGLGLGLARHIVGNPKLSATFETVLSAENEQEVIERLRDQGIPENELDAVGKAMAEEHPTQQEPKSESAEESLPSLQIGSEVPPPPARPAKGAPALPPMQQIPRSAVPTVSSAASSIVSAIRSIGNAGARTAGRTYSPPSSPSTRASGSWLNQQAASEAGKHAEDWLYERLQAAFPEQQILRYQRDGLNRESDFVVRWQDCELHIEAKRIAALPGLIYWTELEFAKAADLGDRYCIAVLLQSGQGYDLSWSFEPTEDFQHAERYVEWIWDGRSGEPLQPCSWAIPDQKPLAPPRTHAYRITVDSTLHGALVEDAPDLTQLKTRILDLSSTKPAKAASGA